MIVAANIGVADEVELIERHLRHLQEIGVDRIVVTDTGSTDGSSAILQSFADRGEIVLFRTSFEDANAFDYANRMLAYTLAELKPDWILFGDADEFPIPRTGRIQDALAAAPADVLLVQRYNVPVGPQGPLWPDGPLLESYDRLELIVRQIPQMREHLLAHPQASWILGRILPKILARAGAVRAGIHLGAHAALPQRERAPTRAATSDVLIAHVPVTTRERFLRKLENIREVFERVGDRFGPLDAWHWRRWMELAEAGQADEEFERQVFDHDRIIELRASGTVMSAAAWFDHPVVAEAPR